ncbi:hypothetical protein DFJ74DRAFT_119554 [Hyaloraphidium curvatum]|nr:hypothetical protein DFJ74DRAFT_119554 [Hyaloraphidium curvatum]
MSDQGSIGAWRPQQIWGSVAVALLLAIVGWNVLSLTSYDPRSSAVSSVWTSSRPRVPDAPQTEFPDEPGLRPKPDRFETGPARKPSCPFGNIDIHINVGSTTSEIAMFHLAMASLDELLPCIGIIHILFTRPAATGEAFPPFNIGLPRKHAYKVWLLEDTFFTDFPWDKKFKHQYARLTADLYVREEADFILFLDSDTLLALPVTCRSLFDDEGKPLWFYGEGSDEWGPGARAAIGINPHVFGVKAYPPLAPKSMLPKLRKAMYDYHKIPYREPFSTVFVAGLKSSGSMSEFNAMGNFMFNTTPEAFSAQKCPLQTDLGRIPENKGLMCGWFPTSFLHFPYPLSAYRDNSPENFRNWDFFVGSRHWSLGKFHDNGEAYTKRAQEAVRWGSCWRRRWRVRLDGEKVVGEKVEAPADPPAPMPPDAPAPEEANSATADGNSTTADTKAPEPVTANPHVVEAAPFDDAACFASEAFLVPPPDCFHYTEGKEGVRFDGKRIAEYLLEETVLPWKGYCSEGRVFD